MDILLWSLQGVLAFMMLMPGFLKISNSKDALKVKGNGRMDWVDDLSDAIIKLIGVLEVGAAFGLILPMLLNILPVLTPVAAIGVIFTMVGAMALHVKRNDGVKAIAPNVIIMLIAAFVLYGRLEYLSF